MRRPPGAEALPCGPVDSNEPRKVRKQRTDRARFRSTGSPVTAGAFALVEPVDIGVQPEHLAVRTRKQAWSIRVHTGGEAGDDECRSGGHPTREKLSPGPRGGGPPDRVLLR